MIEDRKLCVVCNRMFEPYRTFQRYCSHRCAKKINYKSKPYVPKEHERKECEECHGTFITNNDKKVYCSKECQLKHFKKAYPNKEPEKRYCLICDKEFVTAHWSKRYCGDECRQEARRQRNELS